MRGLGYVAAAVLVLAPAGALGAAAPSPEECRALRLHGEEAESAACFEALTRSASAYVRAEGYWGLSEAGSGQWEQANQEFKTATSGADAKPMYKVRWGTLLHERFNDVDAAGLLHEALEADPNNAQAYVELAILSMEGFDAKAPEYVAKAIALNPKLVEADEVAAELALEAARPEDAVMEADKAIALAPYNGGTDALDALAVHAAVAELADKQGEAEMWMAKVAAVNPHYGHADEIVAENLVLNRRYPEGVAYYRKAIAAEPELWSARSELGINLMRLGEDEEPRRQLELCYNHGYRNAATVNSLKLLDTYKNFVTVADDTTILRMDRREAALLQPYFEEQLHQAIATYTAKYKIALKGPVQLEVYPNHEDFAVRTMGMPGLGALGVTFGQVVAMDSPSGRKPGDFNWAATMWHEMSHVFILSATNYRVPRWFTEGLAVHEEGQANPAWANRLTPEVVVAIRDKKLLPVAQLDRGFLFPEYPDQVIVSYWQAGSICDFIQQRWGADALMGMVHSFADRKTTPEAVEANLHVAPDAFDVQYRAWLDKQVSGTVADFDVWRAQLKALAQGSAAKDPEEAIRSAQAAIKLYPEYVEDANLYEFLANAEEKRGNAAGARDALLSYQKEGGQSPEALKKLASLQEQLGDGKGAAATLDSLNFIYPEDEGLHRELGTLWLAQGNAVGAVREFGAVIALKPLDMASAEFDLARAYMAAGDRGRAEESVLASLEAAPGYKPAQTLLLELEGGDGKKSSQPVTDKLQTN